MMEDYSHLKEGTRYAFEEEAARNVAAVSYAGEVTHSLILFCATPDMSVI